MLPIIFNTGKKWLPDQDSNLDERIQSPSCYHYTIRHQHILSLPVQYTILFNGVASYGFAGGSGAGGGVNMVA